MRMVWWREAKWLVASILLQWILSLTQREASREMISALVDLADKFKNDHKWNTVEMRRVSKIAAAESVNAETNS